MGYIEGLESAPGGRTDVEAMVREVMANPAGLPRRQHIVVPVTGAPVAKVEESWDDG